MARRKVLFGIVATVLLLLLATCAPAPAANPTSAPAKPSAIAPTSDAANPAAAAEFQQLLEAARKEAAEGPLFIAIAQPNQDPTHRALFDAFNNRFALSASFEWQVQQQTYFTKVVADAQAGQRTPDVITGPLDTVTYFDEAGLLQSYDWEGVVGQELPGIKEVVERSAPTVRGKGLPHFDVIYTLVYNSSLTSEARIPRTLEELVDPQWDRKLAINPLGSPLDTLGIVVGRENILDIARKLKANRPVFKPSAPAIVGAVVSGEAPLGFGYTTGADLEKSRGAPVEWVPLRDYIPILVPNVMVLKSAQRPNLGRLFAAWLVTEGMPLQEKMEFMGRADARGTPTWERINRFSPQAKIVEVKTVEDGELRTSLAEDITKVFSQ
jgi:iron(III) transport system substrate-binding protein